MNHFLPIGSVVLLKGGKKKLMICGRCQQLVDSERIYDYCGCYYPEGILNPKDLFLFDNEQLERVYFIGFQDEEELTFRAQIERKKDEYDLEHGEEGQEG